MGLIGDFKLRLTRKICKRLYERAAVKVMDTPAVQRGDMPYVLLSMVQHRDVPAYLVALKSFYRQAPAHRVVVVCDPSIDAGDRALLRAHVPQIELREADEFVHAQIPRGGTWERLFAISEFARQDYVVQLDADTVTLGPVAEVLEAIRAGHGFVIGERSGQTIESLDVVAARAQKWLEPPFNNRHIQAVVEAGLQVAGLPSDCRYVRGCSGFTGFPPDPGMRDKLLAFSDLMRRRHGQRWADWGTEQISSNYLVANAIGTAVLPFPKYGTPDVLTADMAFSHFIGYLRFNNRKYERATRDAIAALAPR